MCNYFYITESWATIPCVVSPSWPSVDSTLSDCCEFIFIFQMRPFTVRSSRFRGESYNPIFNPKCIWSGRVSILSHANQVFWMPLRCHIISGRKALKLLKLFWKKKGEDHFQSKWVIREDIFTACTDYRDSAADAETLWLTPEDWSAA